MGSPLINMSAPSPPLEQNTRSTKGIGNGSYMDNMSARATVKPNQNRASTGGGMGSPLNNMSAPFGSTSPQPTRLPVGQNTRSTNGIGNGSMSARATMKPNQSGASTGAGITS